MKLVGESRPKVGRVSFLFHRAKTVLCFRKRPVKTSTSNMGISIKPNHLLTILAGEKLAQDISACNYRSDCGENFILLTGVEPCHFHVENAILEMNPPLPFSRRVDYEESDIHGVKGNEKHVRSQLKLYRKTRK